MRIDANARGSANHFIALVAVARDFVSNVLYDMWRNQRPFFLDVSDYRAYRQKQRPAND